MKYRRKSWISPKIEVKDSQISEKGLFARAPIKKGEVIIIWGGTLITEDDVKKGRYRKGTAVEVGEGIYLAGKPNEPTSKDDFLNHSCDSNLWLKDEVTLIARRNIKKGEELTADYATWVSRSYWKMKCNCGSPLCRGIVTGNDWKRKDVQRRYKYHFSPYLKRKIRQ
jgi:hypothetical protein